VGRRYYWTLQFDDMVFDSDLGGDSDADDNLPYVQTVKSKFIFVYKSHKQNICILHIIQYYNLQCFIIFVIQVIK